MEVLSHAIWILVPGRNGDMGVRASILNPPLDVEGWRFEAEFCEAEDLLFGLLRLRSLAAELVILPYAAIAAQVGNYGVDVRLLWIFGHYHIEGVICHCWPFPTAVSVAVAQR